LESSSPFFTPGVSEGYSEFDMDPQKNIRFYYILISEKLKI
jgi:hypothetical protein